MIVNTQYGQLDTNKKYCFYQNDVYEILSSEKESSLYVPECLLKKIYTIKNTQSFMKEIVHEEYLKFLLWS